jgi:hypothetical protein
MDSLIFITAHTRAKRSLDGISSPIKDERSGICALMQNCLTLDIGAGLYKGDSSVYIQRIEESVCLIKRKPKINRGITSLYTQHTKTDTATNEIMLRMRRQPQPTKEYIEVFPSSVSSTSDSFWWWPTFTPASNTLTTNEKEIWNAGRYAPASIMFSFDTPFVCSRIDLLPCMEPKTGQVVHECYIANFVSVLKVVANDNEWIYTEIKTEDQKTKTIEIRTIESPSWVAWRRARFWKSA